jgi:hypothetical protein
MNVCDAEICSCHKRQLLRAVRVPLGGLLRESERWGHLPPAARPRAAEWEPKAHGP